MQWNRRGFIKVVATCMGASSFQASAKSAVEKPSGFKMHPLLTTDRYVAVDGWVISKSELVALKERKYVD